MRAAVVIGKLKLSLTALFSGELMNRVTPIYNPVTLAVCLNVVTHVTFPIWDRTNGVKFKRFWKAQWVAITEHPLEK